MPARQPPIPRLWLITDERMGDTLWDALERLPRGAGILFRHYRLPLAERRTLFAQIAKIAQRRRLVLVRAGPIRFRGESGVHGRAGRHAGLRTASVHSKREAIAAIRAGADMLFVSPLFETRSHPGALPLGRVRFSLLIRGLGVPIIALGGMSSRRAASLRALKIHGWAGIDAWT